MTEAEKLKIDGLSSAGLGYRKISVATGLPENAVKSYLSRRGKAVPKEAEGKRCLRCGKDVGQRPGRKKKKFCCDKCRNEWWNSHLKLVKRKAVYSFTCPVCGLEFASYGNNHRKYCSRECYIKGRFKEEGRDDKTGEVFDTVQAEIAARSGRERYSGMSIFSSKLVCGDCGCAYGRKTWHSTDRYKKIVWQCGGKYKKKGHPCKTPTLTEDEIKDSFVKAMGQLLKDKGEKLKDAEVLRQIVADTSSLESQKEILEAEMEGLAKALEHDIMTNISLASDQEAYRMRRESLESQWLKKKEDIGKLDDLISDKILRAGRIDAFIEEMQRINTITEFSAQAWGVMVERVTVKREGEIEFSFIDGSMVRV